MPFPLPPSPLSPPSSSSYVSSSSNDSPTLTMTPEESPVIPVSAVISVRTDEVEESAVEVEVDVDVDVVDAVPSNRLGILLLL